jgi:hypothetical protein
MRLQSQLAVRYLPFRIQAERIACGSRQDIDVEKTIPANQTCARKRKLREELSELELRETWSRCSHQRCKQKPPATRAVAHVQMHVFSASPQMRQFNPGRCAAGIPQMKIFPAKRIARHRGIAKWRQSQLPNVNGDDPTSMVKSQTHLQLLPKEEQV